MYYDADSERYFEDTCELVQWHEENETPLDELPSKAYETKPHYPALGTPTDIFKCLLDGNPASGAEWLWERALEDFYSYNDEIETYPDVRNLLELQLAIDTFIKLNKPTFFSNTRVGLVDVNDLLGWDEIDRAMRKSEADNHQFCLHYPDYKKIILLDRAFWTKELNDSN